MRTSTAIVVVALVGASGAFALAQNAGRGRAEGGGTVILEKAPTDHAVAIPLATLQTYYQDMDGRKLQTLVTPARSPSSTAISGPLPPPLNRPTLSRWTGWSAVIPISRHSCHLRPAGRGVPWD